MSNSRHKTFVLGTAQLGLRYGVANKTGMPDAGEAVSLVRRAVAAGVKRIDTARAYGEAEARIGEALDGLSAKDVRVITKLDPLEALAGDASEEAVRSAVDDSVETSSRMLRLPTLPVLLLHRWEHRFIHHGAVWKRLLELRQQGKVAKLGASVYSPEEAAQALDDPDVEHVQLPFNVLDRRWKGKFEVARLAAKRKEATVDVRSIFLQGLLMMEPSAQPRLGGLEGLMKKLQKLVSELGRESRADLCLAYAQAQNWVHGIVLGMESSRQLDENLKLFKRPALNEKECARVESELTGATETLLNPSKWALS